MHRGGLLVYTRNLFGSLIFLLAVGSSQTLEAEEYPVPLGLPELIIPEDNPITPEKVVLGKKLYFDRRLSADDTISCATCHDPERGFADAAPVSTGIKGQKGTRSAPTVLNAALYDSQFWDGRAPTLEEQAKQPIINPIEMGIPSHDALVEKLKGIEEYRQAFQEVFADEITIDNIALAIASFERTSSPATHPLTVIFTMMTKTPSVNRQSTGLRSSVGMVDASHATSLSAVLHYLPTTNSIISALVWTRKTRTWAAVT